MIMEGRLSTVLRFIKRTGVDISLKALGDYLGISENHASELAETFQLEKWISPSAFDGRQYGNPSGFSIIHTAKELTEGMNYERQHVQSIDECYGDPRIVPGKSMGPFSLGMTVAELDQIVAEAHCTRDRINSRLSRTGSYNFLTDDRVVEITVGEYFQGKVFGKVGTGSLVKNLMEVFGNDGLAEWDDRSYDAFHGTGIVFHVEPDSLPFSVLNELIESYDINDLWCFGGTTLTRPEVSDKLNEDDDYIFHSTNDDDFNRRVMARIRELFEVDAISVSSLTVPTFDELCLSDGSFPYYRHMLPIITGKQHPWPKDDEIRNKIHSGMDPDRIDVDDLSDDIPF
jgi:hypothetical protein